MPSLCSSAVRLSGRHQVAPGRRSGSGRIFVHQATVATSADVCSVSLQGPQGRRRKRVMAVWERLPLCFELLSPIHIGFLPKSRGIVVSPTRPYVPGKNLWGAVTAALTPRLYDAPAPSHFVAIGQHVRECLSFSYFYLSDGEQLFAPSYESSSLRWGGLSDSEFRSVVLDSRLSAEIGETGAAEDGGLHEIEFIRHMIGSPEVGTGRVFLCGAAWLKTDGTIAGASLLMKDGLLRLRTREADVDLLDGLTIGGERNYGFGRIQLSDPPN